MKETRLNTKTLFELAIFTALVIALQILSRYLRFGNLSITLALIPIVVGAAVYGPPAGAWLGFVFGVTVLLIGDADVFLAVSSWKTILVVLTKGMLAGWCAGRVYSLLEKKNRYAAVIAAAVVCPLVNTGVFLLGCLLFFKDTVADMGREVGFADLGTFMIVGLVGLNFLVEMATTVILSPAVLRLVHIGRHGPADQETDDA